MCPDVRAITFITIVVLDYCHPDKRNSQNLQRTERRENKRVCNRLAITTQEGKEAMSISFIVKQLQKGLTLALRFCSFRLTRLCWILFF